MNVLVDTSIWSLAVRRGSSADPAVRAELAELISELRVGIIGPIRQELLSGIKSKAQFEELRSRLSAFPDLPLESADFEDAAHFFNTCRSRGVKGSNTDFLICSVATRRNMEIFTADRDFTEFQRILPIRVYMSRRAGIERRARRQGGDAR